MNSLDLAAGHAGNSDLLLFSRLEDVGIGATKSKAKENEHIIGEPKLTPKSSSESSLLVESMKQSPCMDKI